jgi:diaminohydroxyphosphoribosylaminopyrimidine deaminase/5-amino-6-(5-phosphoribosylamino)uracil reductase
VEPNPLVGAVVVHEELLVGAGWHECFGGPHAEVHALAATGARAPGATLYVTLEPCCHFGKTPPCTEAVLRAGIRRVVAAMLDPFPQVSGQGVRLLQTAGVAVEVGLGETEARRLNAPYLKLLATGRPYIHAKWAMSLDGKIATHTGDARWISGEGARQWVHTLRGRMDAIVIGRGTAVADDPLLTARPPGPRTPVRVVLTRSGQLPLNLKLIQTARETPLLVTLTSAADAAQVEALRAQGCEVFETVCADPADHLACLLGELGRRRMTNILVEGGAGVLGSFRDARALDEIHVFVAPLLLGGAAAVSPMGGQGAARVAEGLPLVDLCCEQIEGDVLLHGRLS